MRTIDDESDWNSRNVMLAEQQVEGEMWRVETSEWMTACSSARPHDCVGTGGRERGGEGKENISEKSDLSFYGKNVFSAIILLLGLNLEQDPAVLLHARCWKLS